MLLSFDGHFFQSARAIYTDRNKSSPRRHGDTEKSKGKTYRRFARMIAGHENAKLNFPESALPRITRIYTDQKSSPFSGRPATGDVGDLRDLRFPSFLSSVFQRFSPCLRGEDLFRSM